MHHNSDLRCRDGGIGRRTGLKIPRWKQRAGSIPAPGTKSIVNVNKAFKPNCNKKRSLKTSIFYHKISASPQPISATPVLFGRFYRLTNAPINGFCYLFVGVAKQLTCLSQVANFTCCFRSNVSKLKFFNTV